ncbi:hypothetical protein EDD85DRAFT_392433 [Armillaria nabsnona]|nr:hypothetical protein EDD85DRAFT_392433 [Armillaria nabsnona]
MSDADSTVRAPWELVPTNVQICRRVPRILLDFQAVSGSSTAITLTYEPPDFRLLPFGGKHRILYTRSGNSAMLSSPRSHQTRESPSSMTLSLPMFDLKGGTSTIPESRNVFAVPAPRGLIPLLIMKGPRSSAPVSEDYQRIISFLRSCLLSCQGPHLLVIEHQHQYYYYFPTALCPLSLESDVEIVVSTGLKNTPSPSGSMSSILSFNALLELLRIFTERCLRLYIRPLFYTSWKSS